MEENLEDQILQAQLELIQAQTALTQASIQNLNTQTFYKSVENKLKCYELAMKQVEMMYKPCCDPVDQIPVNVDMFYNKFAVMMGLEVV